MNIFSYIIIAILCLLKTASAPYSPNENQDSYYGDPVNVNDVDPRLYTNDDYATGSINVMTHIVIENMRREMPESIVSATLSCTTIPIDNRADCRLCSFVDPDVKQSMCAKAARELYGKNYNSVSFSDPNYMPPTTHLAYGPNPLACVSLYITNVNKTRYMFYCNDPILEDINGRSFRGAGFFVLGSDIPNKIYGLRPTPRIWRDYLPIFGIYVIYHSGYWEDPCTVDPVFEYYDSSLYNRLLVNPYYQNGKQYLFRAGNFGVNYPN